MCELHSEMALTILVFQQDGTYPDKDAKPEWFKRQMTEVYLRIRAHTTTGPLRG